MGQQEIYDLLKSNKGKWFTIKDLSELTGVRHSTISVSTRKLLKAGLVEKEIRAVDKYKIHFFTYAFGRSS